MNALLIASLARPDLPSSAPFATRAPNAEYTVVAHAEVRFGPASSMLGTRQSPPVTALDTSAADSSHPASSAAGRDELEETRDATAIPSSSIARGMLDQTDVGATVTIASRAAVRDGGGIVAGVVGGRYVLIELVGSGSMGIVYRAYDQSVGREVAIKLLRRSTSGEQARLVVEARTMAQLANPHVVAVYDVVEVDAHDDRVLLVMEYVAGVTLRQWLATSRGLVGILAMFLQAGRGLHAAHRAGIVHRDFKPANVLVGADGRARVTDFGLAQPLPAEASHGGGDVAQLATHGDRIQGTPWYMAPEQHVGAEIDARADQYAFCVALWEALTGAPLFGDANDAAAVLAAKQGPLPAWPDACELPIALRGAVERGLSRDPDDRFPTMDALLATLARIHRKAGADRPSWRALLGGSAAAASLVAVGAWSWQRAERCSGAQARLEGVWDEARRTEVTAALTGRDVFYARETAGRVTAALDGYARAWVEQHRSACAATAVHGEQSPAQLDLRMACLAAAHLELSAAVEILAQADARVVQHAHQVVSALPPLAHCADLEGLGSQVLRPEPSDEAAVAAVREQLALAKATSHAGKFREAADAMAELADEAQAIGYGPLQTEIALTHSDALLKASALAEAEAVAKQAFQWALRDRQWSEAQMAAQRLVTIVGSHAARPVEGLVYAETARALQWAVEPKERIDTRVREAIVLHVQGHYAEAEAELQESLLGYETLLGADHLDVANVRLMLGNTLRSQERYEEAELEQRATLDSLEKLLGPEHPDVAGIVCNLALTLTLQHRFAEAEELYHAAIASWERSLGPEHVLIGLARNNFGNLFSLAERLPEAEAQFRESLRLWTKHHPAHPNVAVARDNLGSVLAQQGRFEAAELEHRTAIAAAAPVLGRHHPQVDAWRCNLAFALQQQRRYDEALEEYRRALEGRDPAQETEYLYVRRCRENLSDMLEARARQRARGRRKARR